MVTKLTSINFIFKKFNEKGMFKIYYFTNLKQLGFFTHFLIYAKNKLFYYKHFKFRFKINRFDSSF